MFPLGNNLCNVAVIMFQLDTLEFHWIAGLEDDVITAMMPSACSNSQLLLSYCMGGPGGPVQSSPVLSDLQFSI